MLMSLSEKLRDRFRLLGSLDKRIQLLQEALGRIESRQTQALPNTGLHDKEFRVFSQWGEDGIIQHLVSRLQLGRSIFVEFGVETYTEASTRFLLINNNWAGLVMDGDAKNIEHIRNDPIYWQHNLKAEHAFITRDNINSLIAKNGIGGEIGLLSVDIDGNDYWVWEAIDAVNPIITIVEYNARFGPDAAVTVPYQADFVRSTAHHSMLYYGASLNALCKLGKKKGYAFVGCNSAGNNAFFVRRDRLTPDLHELSAAEGFVRNQFRESRDASGQLLFESPETGQKLPAHLPLVTIE
jgi:hypothetical protein